MSLEKWNIFGLLPDHVRAKIRLFCVLGANGNEAIFVTDDDEAYGFGTNYSFCLGIGDYGSTLEPKRIEALCGQKVKAISSGASPHVVAISGDGHVFAWGHNGHSQLGNGTQSLSNIPILTGAGAPGLQSVIRIACGNFHTLALTADGENSFWFRLLWSNYRKVAAESEPMSATQIEKAFAVAAHALAVYAWGQNSCGQIGSGCLQSQSHPRKVTASIGNFRALDIACSQTSSFAVLENGEIYAWGYNGNGQLGSGNAINQATPSRCAALAGIVVLRVVCGYAHVLALSDQGHIYAWGANTYGQLGNGTKLNSSIPVRIGQDLGRFVDIAAVHSASISTAMTDYGKVYMWGQARGQFITTPIETPFDSLDDVFASCSSPSVTFRAVKTKRSVLRDMIAAAFDDSNTADVRFVTYDVPDRPIWCHKSILRIRCMYFEKMFSEPWSDRDKEVINVPPEFPYVIYHAFLKYLYTENVSLDTDEALQLLQLANAFCEENLMKDCTRLIKNGVNTGNAPFIYDYALRFNAKELEEYCFRYMLNHMTEITQTEGFLKLDEVTVKNFITKASHNGAFKT